MTETIKLDRGSMIEVLTESMFDAMESDPEYRWLLCQLGFKGYNNMTDVELIQEYREYISQDPTEDIQIIMEKD
jgi:hypothetical protein